MKHFRIFLTLAASVLLLGAVAACSSNDDKGSDNKPAATTAPADGGGAAKSVTVEAKEFSFNPAEFSVPAGEEVTVTLQNKGSTTHTLTVYSDDNFENAVDGADTGQVKSGDRGDFTTTFEAGEYYIRCELHPSQMKGELDAE